MNGTTYRAGIDTTGENIMTPTYHQSYLAERIVGTVEVNVDRPSKSFEFDCPYELAGDYLKLRITNGETGDQEDGIDLYYHLSPVDLPFAISGGVNHQCFIRLRAVIDLYHTILMGHPYLWILKSTSRIFTGHKLSTNGSGAIKMPATGQLAMVARDVATPIISDINTWYAVIVRLYITGPGARARYEWFYKDFATYDEAQAFITRATTVSHMSATTGDSPDWEPVKPQDFYLIPAAYVNGWFPTGNPYSTNALFDYRGDTPSETVRLFTAGSLPQCKVGWFSGKKRGYIGNGARLIPLPQVDNAIITVITTLSRESNTFSVFLQIGNTMQDLSQDCTVPFETEDTTAMTQQSFDRTMSFVSAALGTATMIAAPNPVSAGAIVGSAANLITSANQANNLNMISIGRSGSAYIAQSVRPKNTIFYWDNNVEHGLLFFFDALCDPASIYTEKMNGNIGCAYEAPLAPESDQRFCYSQGDVQPYLNASEYDIPPDSMLARFCDLHKQDFIDRVKKGVRVWQVDYLRSEDVNID